MKVSLEWACDFVDLPADMAVADVARELTLKTVEVEDHVDLGRTMAHVVVGCVAEVEPVASRSQYVATCDIGTADPVTVVTRSSGVITGTKVAVALPGARLSLSGEGATTAEVKRTTIAGVPSTGVLCTAADLRLQRMFPRSPGSAVLDLAELDVAIGTPLADALQWNDHVLEIDNKSLTNRPDLWGHYGIARELAAIFGVELRPLVAAKRPQRLNGLVGGLDLEVCRRLTVVAFTVDGTTAAPLWLRSRLARIGEQSINLCVDLSNYVMFTVGQPTHIYDADRITLPLSATSSGTSTKLELLSGENRELEPSTPVIRDAEGPVALAGIMGGAGSAVTDTSRRFALEVATFRPEVIRRSSQRLAIRTEASARFEKGLDTPRVDAAVDLFLHILAEVAPDARATGLQDVSLDPTAPATVELDLSFLTRRIGHALDVDQVSRILRSLGFTVAVSAHRARHFLTVGVPTWRSTGDVSLPHDIIEEVARIYGYDNLPVAALTVVLTPVRQLNRKPLDRVVREQLATRAGMREIVTYPWAADTMLAASGYDKDGTVRFEGAPAPDRNSLRPSLLPNLLESVAANLRYAESFEIFEVGVVFPGTALLPYRETYESMPPQSRRVAAAFVGADGAALFLRAKGVLEMLRRQCHLIDLTFTDAVTVTWADRSARLGVRANGVHVGTVGLLTKRSRRLAEIEVTQVACFELDLDTLSVHKSRENRYERIPELPDADFDLSVVVADSVPWSRIQATVADASELVHRVGFVDEFRGSWVPGGHRSVTLRVTLRPRDATLTAETIAAARAQAISTLETELDARLRQ